MKPNYAANTVNQTVSFGGRTWRGQPGQDWQDITNESQQNDANKAIADAATANKAATDTRFATDKQDLTNFNTKFSSAVPQIINTTSDKYNLGGLLDIANGLNTRINNVSGNLTGEGAGGYASGAQVDKAIQTNYLPRYQTAVTNLQTGTGLAQNEENMQLTPLTTEAQLLNDRMARETTAYTTEQQQELDGLVEKLKAGVQLTQAQMTQATSLANAETAYNQALETQKLQNQGTPIPKDNVTVNPVSGQIVNPYQLASQSGGIYNSK